MAFIFDMLTFSNLIFCKLSILLNILSQLYFSDFPVNFIVGEESSSLIFWNSGNTIIFFRKFYGSSFYLLGDKRGSQPLWWTSALQYFSIYFSPVLGNLYLTCISINSSTPHKYETFCNFKKKKNQVKAI